jgi:hypothetical protein
MFLVFYNLQTPVSPSVYNAPRQVISDPLPHLTITPRHKPLPILRLGTKPPRLDLIDALAGDVVVLGDASALYFRISFSMSCSNLFVVNTGLCNTYLVESAFYGAVECSAHYIPGAMDGGGSGFYGVVGLL